VCCLLAWTTKGCSCGPQELAEHSKDATGNGNWQQQLATATATGNWQLATFNGNCNIKHLWADGVCVGFWSWTFAWVDPVDVDVDVDPVDMVDRWDHH